MAKGRGISKHAGAEKIIIPISDRESREEQQSPDITQFPKAIQPQVERINIREVEEILLYFEKHNPLICFFGDDPSRTDILRARINFPSSDIDVLISYSNFYANGEFVPRIKAALTKVKFELENLEEKLTELKRKKIERTNNNNLTVIFFYYQNETACNRHASRIIEKIEEALQLKS